MHNYLPAENRLDIFLSKQRSWEIWVIGVGLLSMLLLPLTHPALFGFPSAVRYALVHADSYYWDAVEQQAYRPFDRAFFAAIEPHYHEAKMVFRLVLPLLYRIFESRTFVFVVQFLAGIAFLWLTAKVIYEATASRIIAIYVVVGLVGIYVGSAFVFDIVGCGDAFGYLSLVGAVYYRRHPFVLFLFLQLGYWSDERALICSPFVGLYWLITSQPKMTFRVPKPLLVPLLTLVGSWGIYFAIRIGISTYFDLSTPTESADFAYLLQTPLSSLFIKTARSFESFWVLIITSFIILFRQKRWLELVLISGCLAVSTLVSVMVADTSRSLGYAFVIIFIALFVLKPYFYEVWSRRLLLIMMIINLLVPTRYLFYDV